jgi:hypothetical protein
MWRLAMKSSILRLSLVAAALMFFSLPANSDEGIFTGGSSPGVTANKDECLLVAMNCSTDSIQQRISRITKEISRGTDVYTKDELRVLQRELDDYNKSLLFLERNERTPLSL